MSSDIHALSGAYAVDALDDAERVDFERHLADCASCRDEVAGLRAAAVELAAITEMPPPPSLRASVLAGISDVRPLPPLENAEPAAAPDNVRPLVRRQRWTRIGLAAAAAAVVAGGTTAVVHPWTDAAPPAALPSLATQVMHADDVQRVSSSVRGGGKVTVYRSVSLDRAVVVASGMGSAPSGKVYELWLQRPSGHLAPAGLFSDGTDLRVVVRGNAGNARALGITIEPAGGSQVPTRNPIAMVALA
ncbi:anti-sigma factor [Nocardioides montaniterrae]